jgi:hypothetical protein
MKTTAQGLLVEMRLLSRHTGHMMMRGHQVLPRQAVSTYTLPFEDPIEVGTENAYFAAVINEFESEAQLQFSEMQIRIPTTLQGITTSQEPGDFVWFTSQTATPAIRLILSERVGC